jgi:2-amino-4-hydroxy-6-hydroxymethyldihydropteridine diphosphokinase
MEQAILITGSNRGEREYYLKFAREGLMEYAGKIAKESAIYESAPWGFQSDNSFLNQCLFIQTSLSARDLLNVIITIETSAGRIRSKEIKSEKLSHNTDFSSRTNQSTHSIDPRTSIAFNESENSSFKDPENERLERYIDRTLDIDILFYGNAILNEPDLIIPHPKIESRNFVLLPLSELAPNWIHPVTGKSVINMLADCGDLNWVRRKR